MPIFRLLLVFIIVATTLPVHAQNEDDVQPVCLSWSGMLHLGVKGMPYWVKNNDLKAPVGEDGDLFLFNAALPVDDDGKKTGPVRIAIYCYTEEKKSETLKPISVRTDIDTEKRYATSRQGGGLMGSVQIDEASTVSLFIPHSVYALEPGEYVVRFKVVAFYTERGKSLTEEYLISESIPVEVQKTAAKRGGKSGVRIVNQIAFDATDDGLPPYLSYKLLPVRN